eukprot:tig00000663_g2935.t1
MQHSPDTCAAFAGVGALNPARAPTSSEPAPRSICSVAPRAMASAAPSAARGFIALRVAPRVAPRVVRPVRVPTRFQWWHQERSSTRRSCRCGQEAAATGRCRAGPAPGPSGVPDALREVVEVSDEEGFRLGLAPLPCTVEREVPAQALAPELGAEARFVLLRPVSRVAEVYALLGGDEGDAELVDVADELMGEIAPLANAVLWARHGARFARTAIVPTILGRLGRGAGGRVLAEGGAGDGEEHAHVASFEHSVSGVHVARPLPGRAGGCGANYEQPGDDGQPMEVHVLAPLAAPWLYGARPRPGGPVRLLSPAEYRAHGPALEAHLFPPPDA